ncbi:uncharacterized protein LOC130963157 [Arachis stenosperma]|uniref:uncharacterized protein LOC130963157 n=1 Tax=Arachis stenosperma TaxID=217475 RepID=UPI0025AC5762|nr:uncharacterized protein LOC130963157 [Arachis stenosperma]
MAAALVVVLRRGRGCRGGGKGKGRRGRGWGGCGGAVGGAVGGGHGAGGGVGGAVGGGVSVGGGGGRGDVIGTNYRTDQGSVGQGSDVVGSWNGERWDYRIGFGHDGGPDPGNPVGGCSDEGPRDRIQNSYSQNERVIGLDLIAEGAFDLAMRP